MSSHQVYIRVAKDKIIGVNIGFTKGYFCTVMLNNFLTFLKRDSHNYIKSEDKREIVRICFALDTDRGYFFKANLITNPEIIEDPRVKKPNNGITIVDLTTQKPKIAFMSLNSLKGLSNEARHLKDPFKGQEITYTDFTPIFPKHWMELHYGLEWESHFTKKGDPVLQRDILENIQSLESYDILTVEEIADIFPKMVTKDNTGLNPTPNSVLFIMDDKLGTHLKASRVSKDVIRKRK